MAQRDDNPTNNNVPNNDPPNSTKANNLIPKLDLTNAQIKNLNFGTMKTDNVSHCNNVATGDYANFTVNNNYNNSNKENRQLSNEDCYTMKSNPRGHCLIISNKNFENISEVRKGTQYDSENLEETFKWLGFTVKTKNDCKADEIKQLMEEYSTMNHESFDCFVCCILSHGSSKGISGTDGMYVSTEEIQRSFKECKTLIGKPKVFFIQACRGVEEDNGFSFQADGGLPPMTPKSPTTPVTPGTPMSPFDAKNNPFPLVPVNADFAIAYSTPPGYVSWRNVKTGSWFISSLCDVLQASAEDTDLMDMLTEVNQKVSDIVARKERKPVKQCSETSTTLRKKLYFNPSKPYES